MTESHRNYAIQTLGLTKRFPEDERFMGLLPSKNLAQPAVDGINLSVYSGELFGLLGPNGAGKTTLVKMLATLINPTSGKALVAGCSLEDEAAVKASIGLVTTDERSFYWRLTGRQNLEFFGSLHNLNHLNTRVNEILSVVGLEEAADKAFKAYSTGMRQRLAIGRALLHNPKVLFLDEPTRGLDPPAIRDLHNLIREKLTSANRLTVLMTTHWLHEAEALCDRIAVMHHGQLRGLGTVQELRSLIGEAAQLRFRVHSLPGREIEWPAPVSVQPDGSFLIPDGEGQLEKAIDAVRAVGGRIDAVEREETPLEIVFDRLIEEDAPVLKLASTDLSVQVKSDSKQLQIRSQFWKIAPAFLRRDWQSERSYRFAFLLNFGGILFSAAVFFFVAQLIDAAAAPYLVEYGGSYFAFVLIGIALQRYFGVGLTGFSNAFRTAQTTGTLEAMLTTPARLWQIVVSSSLWSYGLVSLQVLVYLVIGVVFLGVDLNANWPAVVIAALLSIIAFAALGVISASFVMVLKRGDPITWAVSAFSTFFGGVYFPVEVLPEWLQPVSAFLPVTYSLRALRLALLQGAGIVDLWSDLLVLGVFGLILLPLGLTVFRYAVRRAKNDGSLTHY